MATYMNQTNSGRIIVQQTSPSAIIVQPDNERKIILKGSGGLKGETGDAATITVGSTTTGEPGTSASVVNSGTSSDAVLDFVIPKGSKGDKGDTGATGATGPANTLSIGTVQKGDTAEATITGTAPNQTLNLTLPKGDKGDTGSQGPAGAGVITGGSTGQVLTKKSGTNYDTEWATPATYSDFTGATSSVAGAHGLVPAPTTSDPDKFLKGDGTWGTPPGTTYTEGTGIDITGSTIAVDTTQVSMKSDYTVKKSYTIDLTAQSTSNFYPVIFTKTQNVVDCEIHSEGGGAGLAYNQNVLHFQMVSQGWSDLAVRKKLIVLQEGAYETNEITIGCVGLGDHQGNNCVWLRGGIRYFFTCNVAAEAHTSSYTIGDETFSVGTNYYGGTNANVTIYYTPQNINKDVALIEDLSTSIDLTGQTKDLLTLTKALGAARTDYARWVCRTDGGSSNISNKPTGSTNASFVCEATCSRWATSSDYTYQLVCWVQGQSNPYVSSVATNASGISWNRLSPTVNDATLTITQNGSTLGTFSANASSNATIDIPDGGSSYAAGVGIEIANDTIEVDDTVALIDGPTTSETPTPWVETSMIENGAVTAAKASFTTYSTTEQVVGTWIDGKPLYRKTIDCGSLPNNDIKNVSTGLSNVVYRNLYGMAVTPSGAAFPLNTVRPNGSNLTGSVGAYIYGNTVTLETGTNRSEYYAYATIEYTKNSD